MAGPAPSSSPSPLGFGAQFRSLSSTYWISNAMEMLERLAYYGLRTVLPIYMVLAVEQGGPEFDHIQKASIYFWWAAVQSFVPIVSGGYADSFGYKRTVGVSIAIKIAGYVTMAYAIELAALVSGGASVGQPGHAAVYATFTAGALLLAFGTAIFKPGLQGIIATQIKEENSSLAWALFYQLVNLGAFLGPPLAGIMRLMDWKYVFLSCAGIVAFNYLLFFTFQEPDEGKDSAAPGGFFTTLIESAEGILEPRLMAFLAIFSGFWAMFNQFFDLLPNFIDDWVDSSDLYAAVAAPLTGLFGSSPPADWGGMVPQEHMINLNAGLIMLFAFAVGYATGRLRAMQAMIAGILVSAVGILSLGLSTTGFWVLGSIVIFSIGEMMASPTKMRYFGGIAPPGKKALYLGYVNATTGIGWSLGSLIAGTMYEEGGDKVVLARRYLVEETGMAADAVAALAKTEVVPTLATTLDQTPLDVQHLLYETYSPQSIWTWFTVIGVVSMLGLVGFDQITRRNAAWEEKALTVVTALVTGICYGAPIGAWFLVHMGLRMVVGSRKVALLIMVETAAYVAWSIGSSLVGG